VAVFLPTDSNAQRPPRQDFHNLSSSQQQALATLIEQWLDENPAIVSDHSDNFSNGIHNSSNFMPWHRVHIRMLEDFLLENGGGDFVPLPKWSPESTPASGPKIPVPFQKTASGQSVGNMNFNPSMHQHMTNFNNLLNNCDPILTDAGRFSDAEEGQLVGSINADYHNRGHVQTSGVMLQTDSPDALIFWPWHAWVDDHWYQWERDCAGEFDIHDVNGDNVIDITTNTTWSGEMFVKGKVVVPSGVTLTIAPGAVIHFLSSDYNAFETSIWVMPGGRLTLDGGKLTGMDIFGNQGVDGQGGIKYYSGWNGVIVLGNGGSSASAQGRVWVKNGGTIEHAKIGIHAQNGGRILGQGGNFLNCRIGVRMDPHPFNNFTIFTGCNFINDEALRDVIWQSSPIAGAEVNFFVTQDLEQSVEAHMYLDNVTVHSISGCTFDIPFQDPNIYFGGRRGIKSFDSKFTVSGNCIFSNHKTAIDAKNSIPGPGRNATVSNSQFINNIESIYLMGVDYSSVKNCTFEVPKNPDPWVGSVACAIGSDGSASLTIKDNSFSTFGGGTSNENYGIVIGNSGDDFASLAQRNTFTGINIGTQMQKVNTMLQVKCHDFNLYGLGMAVTSGQLADQGLCTNSSTPAGSTWDDLGNCLGSERQIYKDGAVPPFVYAAHSNALPTCVSSGVVINNCMVFSDEQSCADPIDPCGCSPKPCCEVDAISQLETIRQNLISGGGSQSEIWNTEFQQKRKFNEGISGVFESEEEGQPEPALDIVLEFVDDVAAITQTNPADKASLLLLKSAQGSILQETGTVITAMPTSDDKTLFELKLDLLESQRTYAQMTTLEEQTVRAIATQNTKAGAHARTILEMAYSEPATFEVEPIEGIGERSAEFAGNELEIMNNAWLECYPNPAQSVLNVRFNVDGKGIATINLTNMAGRRVAVHQVGEGMDNTTVSFDTGNFAPGLYFIRLETNGKYIAGQKVLITK
jgi:hypothetical protein